MTDEQNDKAIKLIERLSKIEAVGLLGEIRKGLLGEIRKFLLDITAPARARKQREKAHRKLAATGDVKDLKALQR